MLMFRMLVLQALNNLSDEQYQVRDRLSFSRFLGLAIEDSIPDATTLWLFREKLAKAGLIEKVFEQPNDADVSNQFLELACAIGELRYGIVANYLRPAKVGGRGPGRIAKWIPRAKLVTGLECILKSPVPASHA